jgi:hypothetical protein
MNIICEKYPKILIATESRNEVHRRCGAAITSLGASFCGPAAFAMSNASRPEYGRSLELTSAAWPGRLDYTQLPLASRANRRATAPPPGVASASTCFPDADPTMTPRDRPLLFQVRAAVPNKKPKMSARPPDKRFAYWDCARARPRAQGRSPQFWLGSILKCPLIGVAIATGQKTTLVVENGEVVLDFPSQLLAYSFP